MKEIATLTVGYVGNMAKQYVDRGVSFLRSLNIKPFYIDNNDIKFVSESFSNTIRKSILRKNDVVIVRTGIPGTCCVIPDEYDGCNCSDLVIVHPDTSKVNPMYLCAYINIWGQKQIQNNKVGAIQQHFNIRTAEEMLIALPDIQQQNSIARIIENLNDKMFINRKINDNLEQMANQLYEYWFIQFQFPNNDNNPYKLSGSPMVYNSLLKIEIPEGWRVKTVASLLDKVPNTLRVQNAEYKSSGNIPIVDQSASLIAGYTDNIDALLSDEHGYIVFGDHTRVVKYIRFPFARGADGTQILKSSLSCMPTELLYNTITHIDLSNQGYARHFKFLKDSLVIVPNDDIAQKFAVQVSIWHEQQKQLLFENMKLSKLRDWLLPMLMNGQATIDD